MNGSLSLLVFLVNVCSVVKVPETRGLRLVGKGVETLSVAFNLLGI